MLLHNKIEISNKYIVLLLCFSIKVMQILDNETPVRFSLVDKTKMIYRGGQPNEIHINMLHKIGIKNIINLRRENLIERYNEEKLCNQLDINYESFPHYGIFGVDTNLIHEIVDLMYNFNEPTYIHCKNGRDITSIMVASYLVKYHGKDPNVAWTEDVLEYDHNDKNPLYSQFKPSFMKFCDELQQNSIKNMIDNHKPCFDLLSGVMQDILEGIKNKYVVWFQSRLKSIDSLYDKINVRGIKEIKDIIGFRIIYPWTSGLYEIADLLESVKELCIYSKEMRENNKVIYLYGKTNLGSTYEIQLWPTIIYTCFEYEHDKIYKPKNIITDKQKENSNNVRIKEHVVQEYLDCNELVPYDV